MAVLPQRIRAQSGICGMSSLPGRCLSIGLQKLWLATCCKSGVRRRCRAIEVENVKLEDGRRGKREKGERTMCQDVKMWIRCPVMRRRVNIMATYAMDTSEKKMNMQEM